MLNSMTFTLPEGIESEVRAEARSWNTDQTVSRIWTKDRRVWTGEDESKWLGWLDIVGEELGDLDKYDELQQDIESAGFTEILLMGMGGSSLCPEVLAITFDKPYFHILDSTVPAAVKAMENRLDISRTLFIVASKSGSTLEPNCFKQYFFEKVAEIAGRENAGKQFIAITDPGSKMEQIAKEDGFRRVFYGKPEIGGRFSALSAFGLVAAAAMNIDIRRLLEHASEMVEACKKNDPADNPGAMLGLILGVCHRNGRDKLTILTSPEIYDVGAWLEQLIAESTGKNGVAIIPVDQEPLLEAEDYGDDRVFVYLKLKGGTELAISDLENSGHPFVTIELDDIYQLGQEFFRWEFATAVAGAIMGINPFNQPDVESAKIEARKITDKYEETGSLPKEKPFYEEDGIKLFTSPEYATELDTIFEGKTLADYIEAHVSMLDWKDYFALLAYIEMSGENEDLLQAIRARVLEIEGTATCLGFGPRFLHSTGQAYKGGGNNGVFLQITSDDEFDLPVPGQKYTFGVVKAAQARGDFQVLLDRGRRALRVHLGSDVRAGLRKVLRLIEQI
jgi:transaldolase/glucose-6-phosphate isomerase